jgi:hypothetical protein
MSPDDPTPMEATPFETASRRSFMKAMTATLGGITALCGTFNISEALAQSGARVAGGAVDVGSGDIGILNLTYALEQLESAFYTMVLERPYRGINDYEFQVFNGIRNNEVSHREFLRTTLGPNRIPDLPLDFSRVNFASRQNVLSMSRLFEDTGVSALNGAGPLLRNPTYLAAAGSIVSVEARQVAIVRDLMNPLSKAFAGDDVVDGNGLEVPPRLPSQVLARVASTGIIRAPLSASQLP